MIPCNHQPTGLLNTAHMAFNQKIMDLQTHDMAQRKEDGVSNAVDPVEPTERLAKLAT